MVLIIEVIGEQSLIMESLCSEHLLGRWIWKSGKAKGEKNAVPWNVQNINTNPENFLWEKDRCAITTVAPGLYAALHFTTAPAPFLRRSCAIPAAPSRASGRALLSASPHPPVDLARQVRGLFRILHAQEALGAAARQRRARPLRRQLGLVSLIALDCT